MTALLLEEDEEDEKEDPEQAHGMPVPGDAVDQNLTGFELAGDIEADEGSYKRADTKKEVDSVDTGDQIEEVAALIRAEEHMLDS